MNAEWLWSQHVVHRLPLPRLLYLGLVAPGGDIRIVLVLNVILLGAISFAMLRAVRSARGRASWCDLFFVLLWLHWGNASNLLFPFSFTFVLPTALSVAIFLSIASSGSKPSSKAACVIGLASFCLPLCGGPGVTQAPAFVLWMLFAWRSWVGAIEPETRRAGRILLRAAIATALLTGIYFVGFRFGGTPSSPAEAGKTAVKFLSLSLGPVAKPWWP